MAELESGRLLFILAADHRDSLERDLYRLTAPPTPDQAARIVADKLLIYRAVLDAAAELPAEVQPGILIDEQYGASAAELAASSGGAVDLTMPLEASGHPFFEFAYGDAWKAHAEFFATDHSKVLVRDNPGFAVHDREKQAATLAEVSAWAREVGRPLILELLVPATDADKAATGGDTDRYDSERRPGLTVEVMEYLQDAGVSPSFWKIEGLETTSAAESVARTAVRGGRDARCIVLGRHAPTQRLDRWLDIAAPVDGFAGFAIGRSIWWDALLDHLDGRATEGEARARIRDAYLGFAKDYLKASER
ncbi:2-deoxy-5-keto-D-gluconate 6-phosphate aldolase domain-containing protein [Subtercola boreus]|uniref:DUF2090 domain-containing protein n=1 Tax=Subtercola boreus TaxID=120213 RepID=A0A3E0WCR7_9MICO|nr:DUF2090 domain-containing protein [Subtercola boreus]RFA21773.1 hypothetical protein B7R24_05675 [Subtercola boreus]RFA21885.1 hypothetical protein B7R23_05620 [Subtercola boreus]RFA27832.1 hypothetical protein B7R25_05745 [Subtercola boreus]